MHRKIAVIPARGGSKRIPNKNVRLFAGEPLLAYSIRAAVDSGVFDRVILSTDSEDIAEIGTLLGAEVPFLRPENLSDDYTPLVPVVQHAIDSLSLSADYVCCILATAPLIQPSDLRNSLFQLQENPSANFVVPVTTFPFPIQRAFEELESGYIALVSPEHEMTRSQDLPERYHDAGQFYWGTVEGFMTNNWIVSRSLPYHIPRWRVQDIDTLEDWRQAELLYKLMVRQKF